MWPLHAPDLVLGEQPVDPYAAVQLRQARVGARILFPLVSRVVGGSMHTLPSAHVPRFLKSAQFDPEPAPLEAEMADDEQSA